VKVYDVRRTTSDGKSSQGLWPGELKTRKEQFRDDLISLVQTVLVVLQKDVEI
jgi:hypothetical protein